MNRRRPRSDTAEAQLAAAEAEARVAENEATYSTLVADADGTVVATLGEPGQVVSAGQTVVQLAQSGPREAVVALPETIRPAIGSAAEASVYGSDGRARHSATCGRLSDAADPQTRTYEARYVLEGDAASAPLGSTVTIRITNDDRRSEVAMPIGAVLDDGNRTGVWLLDRGASTVRFAPVQIKRLGERNRDRLRHRAWTGTRGAWCPSAQRWRVRQDQLPGTGGELMSFNLSALAVRERAVTLFFIVLLAAAGVYAFVKLGRAEDPSFTIKTPDGHRRHGRAQRRAKCRIWWPNRWRNASRS